MDDRSSLPDLTERQQIVRVFVVAIQRVRRRTADCGGDHFSNRGKPPDVHCTHIPGTRRRRAMMLAKAPRPDRQISRNGDMEKAETGSGAGIS